MRRHFGNSATMIEKDIAPVQKKFQLSFSLRTSSKRSTSHLAIFFVINKHPSKSSVHQTLCLAQQKDPQHQGHSYSCKEERMAVGEVCRINFSCKDILKFAGWGILCQPPSPEISWNMLFCPFLQQGVFSSGEKNMERLRNCFHWEVAPLGQLDFFVFFFIWDR